MTGTTWMMLLSVLLVSVGLSYSGMKKMSKPLPKYTKPEVVAKPARTVDAANVISVEPKKKQEVRNWDLLWKNSLFKDDRTEVEATSETTAEAGSQEQVNNEFELVGIARMGRKDAAAPVAIILEVKNNRNRMGNMNNRNNPMQRRPGGFPGGDPRFNRPNERPNLNSPPSQQPENRKANKSLYRIGDKVAGTDYVIKNIIMEENKVVLVRNGVETVLILDEKNTNNSIRRERVKNEEMAVRAKYAQKAPTSTSAQQTSQPGAVQQPGMGGPPQNRAPGQGANPNNVRVGMQPRNAQPGQTNTSAGARISQPVQQNPTSGMPPLPPTVPGQNNNGVQQNNNTGMEIPTEVFRRQNNAPIPQMLVE